MKIRGITVRLPPVLSAVTVFFAAMCAMLFGATSDSVYVYFAIPLCCILIAVPLFTAYLSEKQLLQDIPSYRAKAKSVRAGQISPAMLGTTVLFEGKILRVTGMLTGKPSYLLADATGQAVAKRFAFPDPLVGTGAQVEVLGTVVRKMTNADAIYINVITIRAVRKTQERFAEKSRIKKLS
jgi:hypothetical protein